jgi:hypothetical protein
MTSLLWRPVGVFDHAIAVFRVSPQKRQQDEADGSAFIGSFGFDPAPQVRVDAAQGVVFSVRHSLFIAQIRALERFRSSGDSSQRTLITYRSPTTSKVAA